MYGTPKLNDTLTNLGFNQLKSDYCCYVQQSEEGQTILLIWVDDFLSISDQEKLNDQIKTELNGQFKVKSLGQLSIIIGVKVHQEDHLIEISQTHYIDALLKKYRLQDANPVSTPMDLNIKLDAIEGDDAIAMILPAEITQITPIHKGYKIDRTS